MFGEEHAMERAVHIKELSKMKPEPRSVDKPVHEIVFNRYDRKNKQKKRKNKEKEKKGNVGKGSTKKAGIKELRGHEAKSKK